MNYIKSLFSGFLRTNTNAEKWQSTDVNEAPDNQATLYNRPVEEEMIKATKRRFIKRKTKKFLTTCKQCGHYRYARCNSKRIINKDYPYEHSPKGGCPVDEMHHIPPGEKYRRICKCYFCVEAAKSFNHTSQGEKKKNQFSYPRTKMQEVTWKEMKTKGWHCRAGLYFQPSTKYNIGDGMSADDAFLVFSMTRDL